jgi:ATP-dependent DNA helicase RecG
LTEVQLRKLGLNERQIKVMLFVKENKKNANKSYRSITEISDESARVDLNDLVDKGLLIVKGKGRGTFYTINSLGD